MIAKNPEHLLTLTEHKVTPEERAQNIAALEEFWKNVEWFGEHAAELRANYTGKFICIAGATLFVGDDPVEVVGRAKVAYPGLSNGFFTLRLLPRPGWTSHEG